MAEPKESKTKGSEPKGLEKEKQKLMEKPVDMEKEIKKLNELMDPSKLSNTEKCSLLQVVAILLHNCLLRSIQLLFYFLFFIFLLPKTKTHTHTRRYEPPANEKEEIFRHSIRPIKPPPIDIIPLKLRYVM